MAKERIEEVDPETNLISFRVIEGDLMKEYKSFLATIQVAPKHGGTGSIVHWHFEYEKISEEVAHPQTLPPVMGRNVQRDRRTSLVRGIKCVCLKSRILFKIQ